jgi:hypothetical protein
VTTRLVEPAWRSTSRRRCFATPNLWHTLALALVSQAGFDGDLDSRVLSLGRGRLRPYAPSEEVPVRTA